MINTCVDNKRTQVREAECACAADAFLQDALDDTLKELRATGWNSDTLAALERARRGCAAANK